MQLLNLHLKGVLNVIPYAAKGSFSMQPKESVKTAHRDLFHLAEKFKNARNVLMDKVKNSSGERVVSIVEAVHIPMH